jgi:hypothetical protein
LIAMTLEEARTQTHLLSQNSDPLTRNRDISVSYAKIYLESDSIRWAGMAAYVSNHVGCVMKTWIQGFCTRWFLGLGNKLVFEDVYPVLLYFHALVRKNQNLQVQLEELRRNGRVSQKVASALFNLVYQDAARDDRERESAEVILEHEQSSILQEKVFDSSWVNGVCFFAGLVSRCFPDVLTVKFHSSCRQKELDFLIRPKRGINYAAYDQRWKFAKQVADRFHSLHESPRVQIVKEHLSDIADRK